MSSSCTSTERAGGGRRPVSWQASTQGFFEPERCQRRVDAGPIRDVDRGSFRLGYCPELASDAWVNDRVPVCSAFAKMYMSTLVSNRVTSKEDTTPVPAPERVIGS